MNDFKTLTFAALFVCFHAASAAASGFFYDCDLVEKGQAKGWVSPKVAIIVEDNGQVSVLDVIALTYNEGAPFPARVTQNNDKRLIVRWVVKDIEDSNGLRVPRFEYAATLNKATGRVTVVATPRNFYGRFSKKGTCAVKKSSS